MANRAESTLQEDLVALYLRLNGYFVSSFIVHSPVHGRNKTELDSIAVRFPLSCEPERLIGPDPQLQTSSVRIDLLLCEVKSRGQKVRFNEALAARPDSIESVLRWAGLLAPADVPAVAKDLSSLIQMKSHEGPACVTVGETTQVRAIVFCPELERRRSNQPWCIDGSTILGYVRQCLCPPVSRDTCATTYDLSSWGRFQNLVDYFKASGSGGSNNMANLYKHVAENAP